VAKFSSAISGPALAVWLAVLSAALAGCPVHAGDTPVEEFRAVTASTKATYYVYLPSYHDRSRLWPMVVTLHGTYGFDSARAQVREWRELAEEHGFVVLAPVLKSTQGILPVGRAARIKDLERDERHVIDAVNEARRKYDIDPAAIMITGFSAGGYPLYYIALRNPELFSAMVARMCNCDLGILKTIPMTEKVRAMPMLIFFSKSGISPVSSHLNPVAVQSWAAFRYLRQHGCTKAEIKDVRGGHQRNPKLAFAFWRAHQKQLRRPSRN